MWCKRAVWGILDLGESVGLYLSSPHHHPRVHESQGTLLSDSRVKLIGQGERAEEGSVQPH